MNASAHERYRARLAALADDSAVLRALGERGHWMRRYARFEPGAEPFAMLVFESSDVSRRVLRVEVYERQAVGLIGCTAGLLRAVPFGTDEGLPTLPAVLAAPGCWTVVRYLPRRRCTLRLQSSDQRDRYLKVYADDNRGQRAHEAGWLLWRAAQRGGLAFDVPVPERWDAATRTLSQHSLDGGPVTRALYGQDGAAMARRIGLANASLALSGVRPRRVFGVAAQMHRSMEIGDEVSRRVPSLAPVVARLLDRLRLVHGAMGHREPRPIHGDPHADQWLDVGHRLGLLDFESLGMGDPELDAAVFLAELDFETTLQLPVDHLEAAYVGGAESAGLAFDAQLMAAYRGHQRLAKALRSARAVRPDGDARVAAHLDRAASYRICATGCARRPALSVSVATTRRSISYRRECPRWWCHTPRVLKTSRRAEHGAWNCWARYESCRPKAWMAQRSPAR